MIPYFIQLFIYDISIANFEKKTFCFVIKGETFPVGFYRDLESGK